MIRAYDTVGIRTTTTLRLSAVDNYSTNVTFVVVELLVADTIVDCRCSQRSVLNCWQVLV